MRYTRQDYVTGKCSHSEYYAQFVDFRIKGLVESRIGKKQIANSTDPHFNDIPLIEWDMLHGIIGGYSPSDTVCIAKEAARQIKKQLEEGK